MSLPKTAMPEGPRWSEQYSLERSVIQAIRLVAAIASPVIKKAVIICVRSVSSAISVEKPITTAMVPGPAIPGMAIGKNA